MDAATKERLGQRWACYSCGGKFYDLKKEAAICPRCQADQAESPVFEKPKTKGKSRAKAKAKVKAKAKPKAKKAVKKVAKKASKKSGGKGEDALPDEPGADSEIDMDDIAGESGDQLDDSEVEET